MAGRRVTFVPAAPEDAPALSDMRRRVWLTTYRGIYPDDMLDHFDFDFHVACDRKRILSDRYEVAWILLNGQRAGYIVLLPGDPLHIMSLYLLAESRGCGLGRAAFAHIRERARALGASCMVLDCHPANERAMGFYRHMGGEVMEVDNSGEAWQRSVRMAFGV